MFFIKSIRTVHGSRRRPGAGCAGIVRPFFKHPRNPGSKRRNPGVTRSAPGGFAATSISRRAPWSGPCPAPWVISCLLLSKTIPTIVHFFTYSEFISFSENSEPTSLIFFSLLFHAVKKYNILTPTMAHWLQLSIPNKLILVHWKTIEREVILSSKQIFHCIYFYFMYSKSKLIV